MNRKAIGSLAAAALTAVFALSCDGGSTDTGDSADGGADGGNSSDKDQILAGYAEMCSRYESCLGYESQYVSYCEMAYDDNVETWYDDWSEECIGLLLDRLACISDLDCAGFEVFFQGKDQSPDGDYPCSTEFQAAYEACWADAS